MSRTEKLYRSLEQLEAGIREKSIPLLRGAAQDRWMIFCAAPYNPIAALRHRTCASMEQILDLADEAKKLREKLNEPWEGSIGELMHSACKEYSNWKNPHRPTDQKLAERLLKQIA